MEIYDTRQPLHVAINNDHQIEYVGFGLPPNHLPTEDMIIIAGDVGNLLYVALTGHTYGDHPDSANIYEAIVARRRIAVLNDDEGEQARAVIRAWGNCIKPWLYVIKLDGDGCPVFHHPDYGQKILLDLVVSVL